MAKKWTATRIVVRYLMDIGQDECHASRIAAIDFNRNRVFKPRVVNPGGDSHGNEDENSKLSKIARTIALISALTFLLLLAQIANCEIKC